MELLSFNIAAGETKRFERAGRYFEIIAADSTLNIFFEDAAGSRAESLKLALAGFFGDGPFSAFEVQNPTAAAQVVQVLVSDGRGGSRRQPGVVSVIDGGLARTVAGVAGIGTVSKGAVAAQRAWVQLWNPLASGFNLLVKNIYLASATAGLFDVRTSNAAILTLSGSPLSKKNQDILAAFEFRSENSAATLGQSLITTYVAASQTLQIRMEEPLMLAPGFGLVAAGQTVNTDSRVMFEFHAAAIS